MRFLLMLTSFANTAGGLVLIGTWATMSHRVPIIVLLIGGSLLIQGAFTILYLHGDLDLWRDLATGALFAGQALAFCVGAVMLLYAILYNLSSADLGVAPVLAGFLMIAHGILSLIYLYDSDRLRPGRHRRNAA